MDLCEFGEFTIMLSGGEQNGYKDKAECENFRIQANKYPHFSNDRGKKAPPREQAP